MGYVTKSFTDTIIYAAIIIPWLKGISLAVGFWQTAFAIIPFYAWYLVIEKYWI